MAEHSPIGWTDATWPIVAGCEYESPGCSNCWAVRDSWRLAHNLHASVRTAFDGTVRKTEAGALVWTGVVRPLPERLDWPMRWKKARRIFVCSQSDLFHQKVPFEFIDRVFAVMALAPQHTFQVLTKHPERALKYFELWSGGSARVHHVFSAAHQILNERAKKNGWTSNDPEFARAQKALSVWPLPNVWFGVTIEDRARAEQRLPILLRMPVSVRWISAEPMLEALDLDTIPTPPFYFADVDWVVCGGESAQTRANTRPFDLAWGRDLRDQCKSSGVAFFMKQLGTKPIPAALEGTIMRNPLPLPEGKNSRYKWDEPEHWPEDLRVQEFPA